MHTTTYPVHCNEIRQEIAGRDPRNRNPGSVIFPTFISVISTVLYLSLVPIVVVYTKMATRLGRDPERSPLLPRGPASRSASAAPVGPSKEELAGCEVFATTLKIRALVIVRIELSERATRLLLG